MALFFIIPSSHIILPLTPKELLVSLFFYLHQEKVICTLHIMRLNVVHFK